MTRRALHVEPLHFAVIESEVGFGGHLAGNLVAQRTSGSALIELLTLEVAEKTGGFSDRDVTALNDL